MRLETVFFFNIFIWGSIFTFVTEGWLWWNLGEDLFSARERPKRRLHTGTKNGTFRSRNQAVLIPTVLFCYNILTFCAPGPGWGQRGWPRLRRDLRDSSSNWTSRSRTCQTWGSPLIQWLQSDCWSPKYQVQPSRDVSPILYCSGDLWIGVFLPVFAPEEGKACHCHRERQLHQEASQHLHCLWGLCFLSRPSFVCGIISRKCVLDVRDLTDISARCLPTIEPRSHFMTRWQSTRRTCSRRTWRIWRGSTTCMRSSATSSCSTRTRSSRSCSARRPSSTWSAA